MIKYACSPNLHNLILVHISRVISENLVMGAVRQFEKLPSSRVNSFGKLYDYESVMHYGPRLYHHLILIVLLGLFTYLPFLDSNTVLRSVI